jgi:hypothetical protein
MRGMTANTSSSNPEHRTAHEVHRIRNPGEKGTARPPVVESFGGLDRARIAALGYALDGPTATGETFTGRVEVYRVFSIGSDRMNVTLIDVLDERVAFRLLNELSLPHADDMKVSVERLQAECDRLARLDP